MVCEVLLAFFFDETKLCVRTACECVCVGLQTNRVQTLLEQTCVSLYIGLSLMIEGDCLFSFNYKLAVLVSEADMQIKKVRHAHLILVNLPPHILPGCQLLCDSSHHRHMPLLCPHLCEPPSLPLMHSTWLSKTDSEVQHHLSKKHFFFKIMNVVPFREGHMIHWWKHKGKGKQAEAYSHTPQIWQYDMRICYSKNCATQKTPLRLGSPV